MFLFKKLKRQAPVQETVPAGKKDRLLGNTVKTEEEPEYEIVEKEILPEKMICPDCGGITLAGLEFCDKCGGELISHDNL